MRNRTFHQRDIFQKSSGKVRASWELVEHSQAIRSRCSLWSLMIQLTLLPIHRTKLMFKRNVHNFAYGYRRLSKTKTLIFRLIHLTSLIFDNLFSLSSSIKWGTGTHSIWWSKKNQKERDLFTLFFDLPLWITEVYIDIQTWCMVEIWLEINIIVVCVNIHERFHEWENKCIMIIN